MLRPKKKKARVPWQFPKSLFKDYVLDSDDTLMRCFEEDWKHMGKPKMKEEQLNKCKLILKKNYRILYFSDKINRKIGEKHINILQQLEGLIIYLP